MERGRSVQNMQTDRQTDRESEAGVLTIGDNRTQHSVGLVSVRGSAVIRVPGRVNARPAVVHHQHELVPNSPERKKGGHTRGRAEREG